MKSNQVPLPLLLVTFTTNVKTYDIVQARRQKLEDEVLVHVRGQLGNIPMSTIFCWATQKWDGFMLDLQLQIIEDINHLIKLPLELALDTITSSNSDNVGLLFRALANELTEEGFVVSSGYMPSIQGEKR